MRWNAGDVLKRRKLKRRKVVLTTDCGADMDDQWALVHLALSPEIELRGIVTTHAPNLVAPAAETAVRVAAEVLDHLDFAKTIPVMAGSSIPLSDGQPWPNPGVDFIIEQARDCRTSDRLVVLVIGAATDLASALLIDASLGDRIEIIAMAFDAWPDGGDSFNVRNDLSAWRVLLASTAPITVGDAVVTRRDLALTSRQAEQWLGGGFVGDYLIELLSGWIDAHPELVRRVTGDPSSWPVWDQVVVAHLLGMTVTEARSRPHVRDDYRFDHSASNDQFISWVTRIDAARLWGNLQRRHLEIGTIHEDDAG